MNYSVEKLYHFTCPECKMWWSVAIDDSVRHEKRKWHRNESLVENITWYCCWCGHRHPVPHIKQRIGTDEDN